MKSTASFIASCAALALLAVCPGLQAQTSPIYTTLYSFTGSGSDGSHPYADLVQTYDGNLYGTTINGGKSGEGTVFRITTKGAHTTLHSFTGFNNDGAYPQAGLLLANDGNLYGTTTGGGSSTYGTIFRITPAGAISTLHSFTTSGYQDITSYSGLTQAADGNFYGTSSNFTANYGGFVFRLTPAGAYAVLHPFTTAASDGYFPGAGVIQGSDGNFYGTSGAGGTFGEGCVYRMTSKGALTVLYSFTDSGPQGGSPQASLIQASNGDFYGITNYGGDNFTGSIFRITAAGDLTTLHYFLGGSGDGAQPYARLVEGTDGNFYGTTSKGGSSDKGTIFKMTPDGDVTILHSFSGADTDGTTPRTGLLQGVDGKFYGTTEYGGSNGYGTVYALSVQVTPLVTSPANAAAKQDEAFAYQITANNKPASYSASGLPAGLSVNTATGLISGTPTVSGKFAVTLHAANASGQGPAATLTLTVAPSLPVITSAASTTAIEGKSFSYQITATLNPTSFAASGLPPGLSVNTDTGVISGIPTHENSFTSTVYATNARGTGSATLTIVVRGPLAITSAASAAAGQGEAFSYQITANGNVTTYGARGLPTGLSLDTATGLITGTPFNSGTAAVEISAGNSTATAFARLTITIKASEPVFTSPNTAVATQYQPFFYRLVATNAPANFTALGLPTGLSLDATKGYITGRPINTGVAAVKVSATNAAGTTSMRLTFTIASYAPVVTSATTASATRGEAFSYQVTATNSPTYYGATGLPTGLDINPSTGQITGMPQNAGKAAVTISATNQAGDGTARLTLTIAAN